MAGRTKSILQGIAGLFAFGDVRVTAPPPSPQFSCKLHPHAHAHFVCVEWQMNPTNLVGLAVNSGGIGWYTYEKYGEAKRGVKKGGGHKSPTDHTTLTRDGSQVRTPSLPPHAHGCGWWLGWCFP